MSTADVSLHEKISLVEKVTEESSEDVRLHEERSLLDLVATKDKKKDEANLYDDINMIKIDDENKVSTPDISSSLDDDDDEDSVKQRHENHGKRKWFCVIGCAIAHFVLGGFERSNGVLYIHIQNKFGNGASDIAWVLSLSVTLKLLFGPVASILCTKFTPRCVVVSGAILFGLGLLISAFVPHFVILYITIGVITGIGKSLAYQPGLVVVGQYFKKRRGAAVGLATAGGGIGTLVLPPLFETMLNYYGFSGGLMIISAVALHMCISGMLYKSPTRRKLHRQSLISHSCERFHDSRLINSSELTEYQMAETEEQNKKAPNKYHKLWIGRCLKSCNTVKDKESSSKMLDFSLLKRPDFLMFCVGISFLALSFNSMLIFIPPLVKSRGLSGIQGACVMSVAGIFDTIGRIASGFILEIKRLRNFRKLLYNTVMFMLALVIFSLPFTVTFVEFCVVAAIFGLLIGTYTSQKSVILVDIVGSEALNSSFGILIFFQGVGTLIGPPITGVFKDEYNAYADGFLFIGSTRFIGAFILLLNNTVKCNNCKPEFSIK
ncbi:monocarboxylate transporter 12-like [Mytilus galloprovincialis]|uniref:monocarboxylate transporter 12-like n=1 Tax=Mytilus galloprovincialis TaxID=29158 RepID=UPI003F7C0420